MNANQVMGVLTSPPICFTLKAKNLMVFDLEEQRRIQGVSKRVKMWFHYMRGKLNQEDVKENWREKNMSLLYLTKRFLCFIDWLMIDVPMGNCFVTNVAWSKG